MTKILVCFDGTGNDPSGAEQECVDGVPEDESITNVLKLHLMAGGSLNNDRSAIPGQHPLYYSGVGTRGGWLVRKLRFAFALRGPDGIMDEAREDLGKVFRAGDELYLFGFSRGAAIARKFASELASEGLRLADGGFEPSPTIAFLGVWDTVAAFGIPNLDRDDRPKSDVLFEDGTIAPNIREALHLVSIDETRLAFRPTLMNEDDRVEEIWCAGVHADVGGGYRLDGLSDISLEIMINAARERGIQFSTPSEISPGVLIARDAQGEDVEIGCDDLELGPDPNGTLHTHHRDGLMASATLGRRKIFVIVDDLPGDTPPIIHYSVVSRIRSLPDYRPENLVGVPHRVLLEDGSLQNFKGLADHLL